MRFKNEVGYFFTALTFLTRIPVSKWSMTQSGSLLKSSVYFPVVGIGVGIICSAVYSLVNSFISTSLSVVIAIAFGMIISGTLHEDGFADVLDSMGGFGKEKKLTIMKDSRLGTYGVCGLIILILLKIISLIEISQNSQSIWIVFILAHSLSRWSALPLIYANTYVSADSKSGAELINHSISRQRLLAGTLIMVLMIGFLAMDKLIAIIIVTAAIIYSTQYYFRRTLGGITGDCIGGVNQLIEVGVYLIFATYISG